MNKVSDKLTVFFEDVFWVGVFEQIGADNCSYHSNNCMGITLLIKKRNEPFNIYISIRGGNK